MRHCILFAGRRTLIFADRERSGRCNTGSRGWGEVPGESEPTTVRKAAGVGGGASRVKTDHLL